MGAILTRHKPAGPPPPKNALVTTEWLAAHIDDPDLRILDCTVMVGPNKAAEDQGMYIGYDLMTGRDNWVNHHIPGAYFVDFLKQISDSSRFPLMMPAEADFCETMAGLGVGNHKHVKVVLYDCTSLNMWAARLWWMLDYVGLHDVYVLDGGWKKWESEGRSVETGNAPKFHEYNKLTARVNHEQFAGIEEVASNEGFCSIISAQPQAEFEGSAGVHMGRKGHIPGSTNVDPMQLFDPETHAFLPKEKLEELFAGSLGNPIKKVFTYCNVGVLAALDAFVLKGILGVKNVAVYDGSLAEWISDPSRLVELPGDALVSGAGGAAVEPHYDEEAANSQFESTPVESVHSHD